MPSVERTSVPALLQFLEGGRAPRSAWLADLPHPDDSLATSQNRTGVALADEIFFALSENRSAEALRTLDQAGRIFASGDPLFFGEDWSPDYWEWTVNNYAVLGGLARQLGRAQLAETFGSMSRAVLAGLALGAMSGPARSMRESEATCEGPNRPLIADGPSRGPALAVALAGCRGWTKAVEADGTRGHWSHLVDTARGAMLLYAAGISAEVKWGGVEIAQHVARRAGGALPFFLTAADQAVLRSFLRAPTLSAATFLADWLQPHPTRHEHSWRRFESAAASVQETWSDSSTAPLVVSVIYAWGVSEHASNHDGVRESKNAPETTVSAGRAGWVNARRLKADRDDGLFPGWSFEVRSDAGRPLWEVHHGARSTTVLDLTTGSPPAPIPSPTSPAPPPPARENGYPDPDLFPPPRPKKRRSNPLPILLAAAALVGLLLWWLS